MFAIDGPMDSISASTGVSALIHAPAARPPGTPPVPARKEVEPAALMLDQLSSASEATTAVVTRTPAARATIAPGRPILSHSAGLASNPADSTAHGAATGNRYWKPFTGQSWKNTNGTAIQQISSDSRHDHRRAATVTASIPAPLIITGIPIAGGTTAG